MYTIFIVMLSYTILESIDFEIKLTTNITKMKCDPSMFDNGTD